MCGSTAFAATAARDSGTGGKQLVVADIAYDSGAVLDCLMQWRPVPYYSLQDEKAPLSILRDPPSR